MFCLRDILQCIGSQKKPILRSTYNRHIEEYSLPGDSVSGQGGATVQFGRRFKACLVVEIIFWVTIFALIIVTVYSKWLH